MLPVPVSALYLVNVHSQGPGAINTHGWGVAALLFGSSIVTTVPLLLFAGAARRLRLSTLGFLQNLAPSLQFTCAVVIFGEAFSPEKMVAFGCIWAAVTRYAVDSLYGDQRRPAEPVSDESPEADEPVAPKCRLPRVRLRWLNEPHAAKTPPFPRFCISLEFAHKGFSAIGGPAR